LGAPRGFATGARGRPPVCPGRPAQGGLIPPQCKLAPPWGALGSQRHYAALRPSCVDTRPAGMSRGATPSHHPVAVCDEHFTLGPAVCCAQEAGVTGRFGERVNSTQSTLCRVGLGTGGLRLKAAVGATGMMRQERSSLFASQHATLPCDNHPISPTTARGAFW
jgi:hypothetical protein